MFERFLKPFENEDTRKMFDVFFVKNADVIHSTDEHSPMENVFTPVLTQRIWKSVEELVANHTVELQAVDVLSARDTPANYPKEVVKSLSSITCEYVVLKVPTAGTRTCNAIAEQYFDFKPVLETCKNIWTSMWAHNLAVGDDKMEID